MNIAKETKPTFVTYYKSKNSQTSFQLPLDFNIFWTVLSLTWTNCRLLQASWDLAFLFSLPKLFLEAPQLLFVGILVFPVILILTSLKP